ncbi:MAG: phosphomevalonate kinase [Myxococcota bacterium]|jgi:phosphomevalonate kinase
MPAFPEVRAPGKLVIIGDYAVLDGAPAAVLAIDRGVRCEVLAGDGIVTPDGDTRFVAPALHGAPPALYRFSAWNPVDLPGKPGFGGSAAACVAACIAANRPAHDAFTIHHTVQGSGSGVDVAASIHGGLIRFTPGQPATPLPLVHPSVIYTGTSAKTGPRVQVWRAWSDDAARARFVQQTAELVDLLSHDPIAATAQAAELLIAATAAAGVDYLTVELQRIMALAAAHGGAAKPSGAGGGDCAVAFFPDRESQQAFETRCAAEGLSPIAVQPAPGAALLISEIP